MLTLAVTVSGADKDGRPKISVKDNPSMGVAPTRVVVSADLNGGPSIEWEGGDDTKSTTSADCEPYEAGKSEIKRRFTADHTYRMGGNFRIQFRLKKKDKSIAGASTSVQIRPGIGDPGGLP